MGICPSGTGFPRHCFRGLPSFGMQLHENPQSHPPKRQNKKTQRLSLLWRCSSASTRVRGTRQQATMTSLQNEPPRPHAQLAQRPATTTTTVSDSAVFNLLACLCLACNCCCLLPLAGGKYRNCFVPDDRQRESRLGVGFSWFLLVCCPARCVRLIRF